MSRVSLVSEAEQLAEAEWTFDLLDVDLVRDLVLLATQPAARPPFPLALFSIASIFAFNTAPLEGLPQRQHTLQALRRTFSLKKQNTAVKPDPMQERHDEHVLSREEERDRDAVLLARSERREDRVLLDLDVSFEDFLAPPQEQLLVQRKIHRPMQCHPQKQ